MKLKLMMSLVLALIATVPNIGCKRELDIEQEKNYSYTIELSPVKKSIKKGDSVTLLFSLKQLGYDGEVFRFRYSQSKGEGELRSETAVLRENSNYDIPTDGSLKLSYTSHCDVPQTLDFTFMDKFDNPKEYSVEFTPVLTEEETGNSFQVEMEPLKTGIRKGEECELKFAIIPPFLSAGIFYRFRYHQPEGSGELVSAEFGKMSMNQTYDVSPQDEIVLQYTPTCHTRQKLVFIFTDSRDNRIDYPVYFEDMGYPYFGIQIQQKASVNGMVELNITIPGMEKYETKDFTFSYTQLDGMGRVRDTRYEILAPDQPHPLTAGQLRLIHEPIQGINVLKFTVKDQYGNQQEQIIEIKTKNPL